MCLVRCSWYLLLLRVSQEVHIIRDKRSGNLNMVVSVIDITAYDLGLRGLIPVKGGAPIKAIHCGTKDTNLVVLTRALLPWGFEAILREERNSMMTGGGK